MKKQRHFKSERSIMAEIYKVQRRQNELLKLAEDHDQKATLLSLASLQRALSEDEVNQLGWDRKQALKARNSVKRLDSTLAKLQQTKASFDTLTLPGMVPNSDVVLQK